MSEIIDKQAARQALSMGLTVKHNSFTDNEFITGKGQYYVDEAGNEINISPFWFHREKPIFDTGWSIVPFTEKQIFVREYDLEVERIKKLGGAGHFHLEFQHNGRVIYSVFNLNAHDAFTILNATVDKSIQLEPNPDYLRIKVFNKGKEIVDSTFAQQVLDGKQYE